MPATPKNQMIQDPIHFIGIGGSGMSGLAELALKQGWHVQGSDLKSSEATTRLTRLGAKVLDHHDAKALGQARSVVYSSAISTQNEELEAARRTQLAVFHRSEFLAALMNDKQAITVAGTHGKSTTSAMITYMLDKLGVDPSASIGGVMRAYGSAARYGESSCFVAEADESDGSFLRYRPFIGIITNVASDHMEYFKNQTGLETNFRAYLERIDQDGVAIIGWDSPLARQIGSEYSGHRLTFGFVIGSEVRGLDYRTEDGETRFTAVVERDKVSCRLPSFGRHNALNALCALAVARALELDVKKAAEVLADFPGVNRRMSLVSRHDDVWIFDDYAHNPGKIAACVDSLKEALPRSCLHVVYQPHRYSRLETMYDDMLAAVESADCVYVLPVYSAGETTSQDFSPTRLASDMTMRLGIKAIACENFEEAIRSIKKFLQKPAVILTVGAGDVWKVADKLRDDLS